MSLYESSEEITHVDLDAQTPLPARLPSPPRSLLPIRALGIVALLVLAIVIGHGCGG